MMAGLTSLSWEYWCRRIGVPKKSKKIQPIEFTDKDLRAPQRKKPLSSSAKPLAEFKRYGSPLTLVISHEGRRKAPSITGHRCIAAWKVMHSPETLETFQELSARLGNVRTLYHGTKAQNITAIAEEGLRPGSHSCMFGSGIYMGSPAKAWGYGHAWNYQAHYLLEVQAILGKVLECPSARKMTLRSLGDFSSVAGVAGLTSSWSGTLRHSENVVYSPDQVLVVAVYEYQATLETLYDKPKFQSGKCGLLIPSGDVPKGIPPAWSDLVGVKPCDATAVVQVNTDKGQTWVCNACISRFKLKVGSQVQIRNPNRVGTMFIKARIVR